MTVYWMLKRSGVALQPASGAARKGQPWSEARRSHHPKKENGPNDGMTGAQRNSVRAIGNKSMSGHGYVTVHLGVGQKQYEHVLVAERALGRKLNKGEVVHHINCIKTDNRPKNLLICTIRYHLQLHARMRRHPYWKQF